MIKKETASQWRENSDQKFSINATTCTLKNNFQNNGDVILNGNKLLALRCEKTNPYKFLIFCCI